MLGNWDFDTSMYIMILASHSIKGAQSFKTTLAAKRKSNRVGPQARNTYV